MSGHEQPARRRPPPFSIWDQAEEDAGTGLAVAQGDGGMLPQQAVDSSWV
jgi:hypothetical protein